MKHFVHFSVRQPANTLNLLLTYDLPMVLVSKFCKIIYKLCKLLSPREVNLLGSIGPEIFLHKFSDW